MVISGRLIVHSPTLGEDLAERASAIESLVWRDPARDEDDRWAAETVVDPGFYSGSLLTGHDSTRQHTGAFPYNP